MYQEKCECCGHLVTAYSHSLNKPLVMAFEQLIEFYKREHKPANLQKDLNLEINQYNNFQKLQYFGLVKHIKQGWLPTEHGFRFYYKEAVTCTPVITINGKNLDLNHPALEGKKQKTLYIDDIIEWKYKERPQYQEEKSQQMHF